MLTFRPDCAPSDASARASRGPAPRRPAFCSSLRAAAALAGAAVLSALAAVPLRAQLPGLPVVENGFFGAGATVGANLGLEETSTVYALAGSWTPTSERWKLTGGAGWRSPNEGEGTVAFGVRGAYRLPYFGTAEPTSALGLGAFVGAGGYVADGLTVISVPIGAALGYRGRIGEGRGFAVAAAPFIAYNRLSGTPEGTDASVQESGFVIRLGLEGAYAVTPRIGVALALEFGQDPSDEDPGNRGTVVGVGAAFRF